MTQKEVSNEQLLKEVLLIKRQILDLKQELVLTKTIAKELVAELEQLRCHS